MHVVAAFFCSARTVTATFDWSQPSSLTPAYSAPDASNRYGEYIGNVEFSDNGVTCLINDDDVKEGSQKARFLYGYNTQMVEMRAYAQSDIIVTAPEGLVVTRVAFAGAKADGNYMTPYDANSAFTGQEWESSEPGREARFYVEATINCTSMKVVCTEPAGVTDVTVDEANAPEQWYTLQGQALKGKPVAAGLYIERGGGKVRKVVVK